jgi:hypothetical protein
VCVETTVSSLAFRAAQAVFITGSLAFRLRDSILKKINPQTFTPELQILVLI